MIVHGGWHVGDGEFQTYTVSCADNTIQLDGLEVRYGHLRKKFHGQIHELLGLEKYCLFHSLVCWEQEFADVDQWTSPTEAPWQALEMASTYETLLQQLPNSELHLQMESGDRHYFFSEEIESTVDQDTYFFLCRPVMHHDRAYILFVSTDVEQWILLYRLDNSVSIQNHCFKKKNSSDQQRSQMQNLHLDHPVLKLKMPFDW